MCGGAVSASTLPYAKGGCLITSSGVAMNSVPMSVTQRLFPNFSELQVRVDGVNAMPRRLDAVDVAVESRRVS